MANKKVRTALRAPRKNIWATFKARNIPGNLHLSPAIYRFIDKNSSILDLGCGSGRTCFDLYEKGYRNIFGVDINRHGINFAKTEFSKLGMDNPAGHFKVADAQKVSFADSSFNCVITQTLLAAMPANRRLKVLQEVSRVLKDDGVLYLAEFAQAWLSPKYRQRYLNGIKRGYERGTFDAKTGETKFRAHHFTRKELDGLLKYADLKAVHYSREQFVTKSGNKINGHLIIARKG